MAIDFSNSGYSADDFDDFDTIDQGGSPEPGVYHARLEKEEFDEDKAMQALTFSILAGTVQGQKGRRVTERLYLRSKDDDDSKTKKAIQRAMAFGKRMNIYTKEDGQNMRPIPFEKCVGKEFIIEVQANDYEADDGSTRHSARLTYMGIWHAAHPDAPECPRLGKPGSKPGGGSSGKVDPAKQPPANKAGKTTTNGAKAGALTEI